ncbi:hypothetical protein ACMATS_06400 [Streptoverticillium reticulum]|uniref:hypothetical protein n=1 Tax=Streptoverticillium reticulum TaxID=1433415 RepID=UPI0039BF7DFC
MTLTTAALRYTVAAEEYAEAAKAQAASGEKLVAAALDLTARLILDRFSCAMLVEFVEGEGAHGITPVAYYGRDGARYEFDEESSFAEELLEVADHLTESFAYVWRLRMHHLRAADANPYDARRYYLTLAENSR